MRRSNVIYNARVSAAMAKRRLLRLLMAAVLALAAGGVLLDRVTGPDAAADHGRFHQRPATLVQVVDGDTIVVMADGVEERVRLVGIDAAEASPPAHWHAEATAALSGLLAAGELTLTLPDLETRDRYGRLLAYVWAGDVEANLALVAAGHVYADRRFDHERRDAYERAESQARRREMGLWKDATLDDMPMWRRRWLEEREAGRNPI